MDFITTITTQSSIDWGTVKTATETLDYIIPVAEGLPWWAWVLPLVWIMVAVGLIVGAMRVAKPSTVEGFAPLAVVIAVFGTVFSYIVVGGTISPRVSSEQTEQLLLDAGFESVSVEYVALYGADFVGVVDGEPYFGVLVPLPDGKRGVLNVGP